MNTEANTPDPGLAPELSVLPAVAIAPDIQKWTLHRVKDILVTIYAFGLLGFGLFFPFLLAAWTIIFNPAGQ